VKVDLRNADEVLAAHDDIVRRLGPRDPRLRVKVQKMVKGGREVILGMSRDPQYGPLLMFGLGGIHVEVLRDVAVRVHPISDVQAREMITSIRGYPLLAGVRGERPVDLAGLELSLQRLSALVADFNAIEEMDINPMIVSDRPGHSLIVDARVRVAASRRSNKGSR
jgi:acetyltransferase